MSQVYFVFVFVFVFAWGGALAVRQRIAPGSAQVARRVAQIQWADGESMEQADLLDSLYSALSHREKGGARRCRER